MHNVILHLLDDDKGQFLLAQDLHDLPPVNKLCGSPHDSVGYLLKDLVVVVNLAAIIQSLDGYFILSEAPHNLLVVLKYLE